MLSFILCYLAAPIVVGIIVQLFSYWLNKKDSKK
ncbi:type I toxin-antitoxin system Fst family toxin (plasmid) [Lactococcus petauri]|nr:type I toxin-antitoxin system Fst family toxin [Lactococcus petauri]